MDIVMWIVIVLVVIGVVWWLVNRNNAARNQGGGRSVDNGTAPSPRDTGVRTDGALSGGSAAASAEAAGTAGIASAAGFGRPAEPAAPTTAEETPAADERPAADGSPDTTGHRAAEEPGAAAPAAAHRPDERLAADAAATGETPQTEQAEPHDGSRRAEQRRQDEAEWETQWSEAGGTASTAAVHHAPASPDAGNGLPPAAPVHHPEYTEAHAPTLPGAETAAVEEADDAGRTGATAASAGAGHIPAPATGRAPVANASHTEEPGAPQAGGTGVQSAELAGDGNAPGYQAGAAAETADRTQSSALVENGADHRQAPPETAASPEPQGHLAADEPYGTGSAAPAADGSGPAGFTVKGDAGSMVYYEEDHPEFEQTRAEVWFESAAHAEAAGFRAPRRRRL
ncbi:hypothetical protein JHV56_15390 [Arthrobacter sp. BHU FT2]|nr:hypothetical protein [Arthrobacter sp. BHU FT2]